MRTTRAIAAMSGGLSVLTIETGVEAMVRDACQLEGRGHPGSGLGHPWDLAQRQRLVIASCRSGRILAFPRYGYALLIRASGFVRRNFSIPPTDNKECRPTMSSG